MINNLKKIKENKNILCGTKLLLFIILFFYLVKNIIYLDFKENILSFFPLMIALFYFIFKIEDIYREYKNSEKKRGIWYAIYFSTYFTLLYNPLEKLKNEVIEFKRNIGMGIIENINVSRVINNFNSWFFIFTVFFISFFLLANYFKSKEISKENKKVIIFLDNFIVLANIVLLFRCISYFNNSNNIFYYSYHATMLIVIVSLIYIFSNLKECLKSETYLKIMIIVMSISYPVSILISKNISFEKFLLGVQIIIMVCTVLILKLGKRILKKINLELIVNSGVMILSLFPIMTSIYLEMINIFNQWGIFVSRPRKYYFIFSLLFFIVFLINIFLLKNKKYKIINWKNWTYPCFVLGVSCLSIQIPLQSVYNPDIFEGANYSILISDFFKFGSFPIVEHYGGHMMTDVWEGIIYGILNNDITGAFVSPYSVYFSVVLSILFYYFIKIIWNDNMALFVTLLFPFYASWNYFGLGVLVCLAAILYIKKNSYPRAIFLWGTFIWCSLYRLDIGYAFGLATIISIFIYVIKIKNWKAGKTLILSLLGWSFFCGIIWYLICVFRGINPQTRLIEFLKISLSNQNWAYGVIGNVENTVFFWSYMLIPFIMIVCLIYTVFSEKFIKNTGKEKWILLMILGFSFFANFSRGIVRHSLIENKTHVTIFSAYIFLSLFFSCVKKNKSIFLPIFTCLILINTLFLKSNNFYEYPIIDNSNLKLAQITKTWTTQLENGKTLWKHLRDEKKIVNRVELDKNLKQYIKSYQIVIDTLLDKDETFADFMNKTLLYSAINRKNPVYISQSPLQLSGEFTQEQFVEQIKDVPIALMPVDSDYRASIFLDGIENNYRNYKVAEYIYQNYKPLIKYGDSFSVWCLKDRCEEMKKKSESLIRKKDNIGNFSNYTSLVLHDVEISKNNGEITVKSIGSDPFINNIQELIDLKRYIGNDIKLKFSYKTSKSGNLQIYYTEDKDEVYSEYKSITTKIKENGIAEFVIPITEHTKIRLDIPDDSILTLYTISVDSPISYIDYGYDGPYENITDKGQELFYGLSHNYNIKYLPYIWAEYDIKKSVNNKVLFDLIEENSIFTFNNIAFNSIEKGNYLLVSMTYDGLEDNKNGETLNATIKLGNYKSKIFDEKYQYSLIVKEGTHNYIIRVSSDYYWYTKQINSVQIISEGVLKNIAMKILEGD